MVEEKKKTRGCGVCKLCESVPIVSQIVHKDKFEEVLSIDQVAKRILDATGKKITSYQLNGHYLNHLSKFNPLLEIEYKKQATMLKSPAKFRERVENAKASGIERKAIKSATNFDAIQKLKELFVDLNSRLAEFQKKEGTEFTKFNMDMYRDMIEGLRKIAYDVAKVELDRSYMSKILLIVYKEVIEDVIQKIGDGMREAFGKTGLSDEEKDRVAKMIKEASSLALTSGIGKLEKELSQRL